MLPDWSALPADAIKEISSRISDDADYVRFRSVCTSWRSAASKKHQLPWILVYYDDEIDNLGIGLCNFPNSKLSNSVQLPLGFPRQELICGSSLGWIALLNHNDDNPPAISLHNPFTRGLIRLPLLTDLPWISKPEDFHNFTIYYQEKIVLSSDPLTTTCVIMTTSNHCKSLIYCRPGDDSWTPLSLLKTDMCNFTDIIFYDGRFYAVSGYRVFVCDIGSHSSQVTEILPADPFFSDDKAPEEFNTSYLVVSSGDLLLVSVTYPDCYCDDTDCKDCEDFRFFVFRVDFVSTETFNGQFRLFRLDNLGGRSLFLGRTSMSVSAGNSPSCKGDCIYYNRMSDRYLNKWNEKIIVFDMGDNSITYANGFSEERMDGWEIHWITPSLC